MELQGPFLGAYDFPVHGTVNGIAEMVYKKRNLLLKYNKKRIEGYLTEILLSVEMGTFI